MSSNTASHDGGRDEGDGTGNDPHGRPISLADEPALEEFLAETDAALVEFYTEGCGICASMEPVLGNVARELAVDVALLNPRDDPPLVERFSVQSVPKFVLFVDGQQVDERADGFVPNDELVEWVDEYAD